MYIYIHIYKYTYIYTYIHVYTATHSTTLQQLAATTHCNTSQLTATQMQHTATTHGITWGTGLPHVPFTPVAISARNMEAISSATRVYRNRSCACSSHVVKHTSESRHWYNWVMSHCNVSAEHGGHIISHTCVEKLFLRMVKLCHTHERVMPQIQLRRARLQCQQETGHNIIGQTCVQELLLCMFESCHAHERVMSQIQ